MKPEVYFVTQANRKTKAAAPTATAIQTCVIIFPLVRAAKSGSMDVPCFPVSDAKYDQNLRETSICYRTCYQHEGDLSASHVPQTRITRRSCEEASSLNRQTSGGWVKVRNPDYWRHDAELEARRGSMGGGNKLVWSASEGHVALEAASEHLGGVR